MKCFECGSRIGEVISSQIQQQQQKSNNLNQVQHQQQQQQCYQPQQQQQQVKVPNETKKAETPIIVHDAGNPNQAS
jgi:hypothetical protein